MSRISRLVVLVTALASLFGVMSATAGAVTWTNHGTTTFTATGGAGTLTATGVAIQCTGSDVHGDAPLSSSAATYLVSATITFGSASGGCLAAGSPASIECSVVLTATTVNAPVVPGIADVTCGLYVSNVKLCHIEGSVSGSYTNETGTLTVATSGNGLRLTGASCPAGSNDLGHLTPLDFRVTTDRPPTITRAA